MSAGPGPVSGSGRNCFRASSVTCAFTGSPAASTSLRRPRLERSAVRAPARPHRVLDAGRRSPAEADVQGGRAARADPCRDDRPRQHVRRRRVPQAGHRRGHHPGDRDRGVRRPGVPFEHQTDPVGPAAPEAGRRLGVRRLHPQDHLGPEQGGPAQPLQADLALVLRGLAGQVAADGQGADLRALRRPDGDHRLPVR